MGCGLEGEDVLGAGTGLGVAEFVARGLGVADLVGVGDAVRVGRVLETLRALVDGLEVLFGVWVGDADGLGDGAGVLRSLGSMVMTTTGGSSANGSCWLERLESTKNKMSTPPMTAATHAVVKCHMEDGFIEPPVLCRHTDV